MDDLEDCASAHCSHLSKTVRDHVANMVQILALMGDDIPSQPQDRFTIYRKHKIPEAVFTEFDAEATLCALKKNFV